MSVGQVLRVPFARLTPWPGAIAGLARPQYAVVALDPGGPESIESVAALTAGRRLAVLVGAEGNGLSEAARAAATHRVRVMVAGVDSLNVATARPSPCTDWCRSGESRVPPPPIGTVVGSR